MSEQFEHSIRKKLQDAEAPFEPSAWERMEKLLDDPRRRRPLWWWLGGLALILGLGGWWLFSRTDVQNPTKTDIVSENQTSNGTEKIDPVDQLVGNRKDTIANTKNNSAIKNPADDDGRPAEKATPAATESPGVDKPASSPQKSSVDAQLSRSRPGSDKRNVDRTASSRQKSSVDARLSQRRSESADPNVDKPASSRQKSMVDFPAGKATDPRQNTSPASAGNLENAKTQLPATIPTQAGKNSDPVGGAVDNSATPANAGNDSRDRWKAPQRKGFEGGIFLGPDVNATASFTGLRAGFTGGILLRYHVNNRWFFSTGAAYTKKLYGASPKEYNSPYPGNYVDIDADCDVIDVPLQVHFVFADRPSGRWNVSAGASTYFMLREEYDYYYPNNYKRTRVFSNQNQHWFSVINLSAGWEKNTKGRVKWGLQPYVKIPAGGVGEGKVKLYSAGVSLQLSMGKK